MTNPNKPEYKLEDRYVIEWRKNYKKGIEKMSNRELYNKLKDSIAENELLYLPFELGTVDKEMRSRLVEVGFLAGGDTDES